MTNWNTIRTHFDHLGKVMAQRERMKAKGLPLNPKIAIGIQTTVKPK